MQRSREFTTGVPRRWSRLLVTALLSSAALVALTAVSAPQPASADDVAFADIGEQGFAEAVEAVAAAGVIVGCTSVEFCPERDVTRGQLATMLVQALELEPLDDGPFLDVADSIHQTSINAIADADIVNGCAQDRFCAEETVTRAQMATMLVHAFSLAPSDTTHFDDATGVHGDNIDRVADAGITAGCTDPLTHFCAEQSLPRWQAATLLARALGLVGPAELTPLDERRAEQERIDAEREAARRAEEEARRAEEERRARERAAADPWGISKLSDERIATWERLAQCESNGNWRAISANGLYYGGLQFHPQTWRSVGGTGMPHEASREEQIYRAERLLKQSWATWGNQWPACSRRLGLS